MRSVLAWIPAVACACTPDADEPAQPLELDIVISDDAVTVYTSASDLAASECLGQDMFPAPGTTTWINDIVQCKQGELRSCLTSLSLQLGGSWVAGHINAGRAMRVEGSVGAAGGGELLIAGCGGSAAIELPAVIAPQPTLTVVEDPVTLALTATWTATPPAASAVIAVVNNFWGEAVHVTASPYTYPGRSGEPLGAFRSVVLQAFAPPTVVPTSFGPARIWTGGSAVVVVEETATHIP